MSINDSYNEEAIVEAIAVALDNFYTNLIKKVDSLNIKAVMKRKNPYLFRAKAMNGAAQIIDAILAAFVSSSEETIFGNVFFEPIATAAAQGQKAFAPTLIRVTQSRRTPETNAKHHIFSDSTGKECRYLRISTLFSCQYLILNFPHRVCTYENIDLLTIAHCFLIRYAHMQRCFLANKIRRSSRSRRAW